MAVVCIVIPIHNEEGNITSLVQSIQQHMPKNHDCRILFVNDGSTDNSAIELGFVREACENVGFINFTRNFGHQAALLAGLEHSADADAVITMDGDFQDPPELLPQFIEKWETGYPVVYGRREIRTGDSIFKRITASLYYSLLKASSQVKIPTQVGDYRLLDRQVVHNLVNMSTTPQYLRGMIAWMGYDHAIINYKRPLRRSGVTHFTVGRMLSLAMDGLVNFSVWPLKIGFLLGTISIALGFAFIAYILVDTLIFNEVYPLYKWLSVIMFIFMGFIFVLLWLLGEYIGRIHKHNKGWPLYIVQNKSKKPKEFQVN